MNWKAFGLVVGVSMALVACSGQKSWLGSGGGSPSEEVALENFMLEPENALEGQMVSEGGYQWKTLKVGAGGFITGIDFSSDGSVSIARTDTYGLYRWTKNGWKQLLTRSSLPPNAFKPTVGGGVVDVAIAPSNKNRVFMVWNGSVFRSDNQGNTWSATALNLGDRLKNANDDWRTWGGKLEVDPRDANTVLLGTPRDGLFRSTDAGSSWQKVSSLPPGQPERQDGSGPGITGIVFDAAPGRGVSVYASSYKNGVYQSLDSGVTWNRVPGSPPTLARAEVASDGTLFGTSGSRAWRWQGGVWKTLQPAYANDIVTVAVSPRNPKRVVAVSGGGGFSQSLDGGETWKEFKRTVGGGDIPWHDWRDGDANGDIYFTTAQVRFDPKAENRLWTAGGAGVYRTEVAPTASAVKWQMQSRGIEQLVGNDVIAPPGLKPVVAAWDFGTFYIENPDQYAKQMAVSKRFNSTWQLDYQGQNPRFMVGNTSDHRFCCSEDGLTIQAGYSEDGGQSWTRFATQPKIPGLEGDPFAFGFGSIAVSSDNPDNIVWLPTFNRTPYYTLDRGKSWQQVQLPGLEFKGSEAGSHFQLYLNRKVLTADKTQPGTFYLAHSGVQNGQDSNFGAGLYRTLDGGKTWARVFEGELTPFSVFNATLKSVPGKAGHLFFSSGGLEGEPEFSVPFRRSSDGGTTWTDLPNLTNVHAFGFGKAAPGASYPTLYAAGFLNKIWGVYRSSDNALSWKNIGSYPLGSLDDIRAMDGDKDVFGKVYLAFGGSGFGYGIDPSSR